MIKKIAFLVFVFVMFVSVLSVFAPVQNVVAGTNGQQLEIKNIMGRGAKVTATGVNNSAQIVTWTGWTPGTPSQIAPPQGETVKTTGWWWIGRVYIRVYWPSSTTQAYACYKEVNKTQIWSDWTTASVGLWRTSVTTPCG